MRSAQRRVGTTTAQRIKRPPIVGVPALAWWVSGPSSLIACPICSALSLRTSQGPSAKQISIAEKTASAVRKLTYVKMRSGPKDSCRTDIR